MTKLIVVHFNGTADIEETSRDLDVRIDDIRPHDLLVDSGRNLSRENETDVMYRDTPFNCNSIDNVFVLMQAWVESCVN